MRLTGSRPREHIAHVGPMLMLAGRWAGSMAEAVVGTTAWVFVSCDARTLGTFLIGCAGAALTVVARRGPWRSIRFGIARRGRQ